MNASVGRKITLIDVDGTMLDPTWRLSRLGVNENHSCLKHLTTKQIWHFMSGCENDPALPSAFELLASLDGLFMFMTARWQKYERETRFALQKHFDIGPVNIIMRPYELTHLSSVELKVAWITSLRHCYNEITVVDDDDKVLETVATMFPSMKVVMP